MKLIDFVTPLVNYGTLLSHNASRLSHVTDSSVILLPASVQMSRYVNRPSGNTLSTVQSILNDADVGQIDGLSAKLSVADRALRDGDLAANVAVKAASIALTNATPANVGQLSLIFVQSIAQAAPYDAIGILLGLSQSVKADGSPYVVYLWSIILCSLAQAILDYTPSSSSEAATILEQYLALFDVTSTAASDLRWSDCVATLNDLRSNVCGYIQTLLATEPATATATFAESVPDVVACYSIYGNLKRLNEIVIENTTDNPLYMPTSIVYTV